MHDGICHCFREFTEWDFLLYFEQYSVGRIGCLDFYPLIREFEFIDGLTPIIAFYLKIGIGCMWESLIN